MEHAPAPLLALIAKWSGPAQQGLWACRAIFHDVAGTAGIGHLDESLKWGQPAWRPTRPRQGSTLRANWSEKSPQTLALFVDCKTTLAATMRDIYPSDFVYESNRALHMRLDADLPAQAIDPLARLTFTYPRNR